MTLECVYVKVMQGYIKNEVLVRYGPAVIRVMTFCFCIEQGYLNWDTRKKASSLSFYSRAW